MANASIDIYNTDGSVITTAVITKDAERVEELMTADHAQLSWQSDSGTSLPAGAYITFEGEKLSLLDPYEPEQKNEAEWSYRPQFQSRVMGWQKVPFFHYIYGTGNAITGREPDWTLTDTPANFMRAICTAIKNETGEVWTFEVAADLAVSATISFAATDIFSGINSIASEFGTEWRADKTANILYLGKARFGNSATLTVGDNISVPSVTLSKERYYNRFFIYGSTRNITQDYQGANTNSLVNKRLTLDPVKYPGGYIDIPRATGVPVYPKILRFDDVYPHSGLSIANLRPRLMYRLDESQDKIQVGTDNEGNPVYDMYTIWYFQLPGFFLNDSTYSKDNPTGMLISGKSLSVHFKSGALQGREFELIYHSKSQTLRNSDGQDFNVLAGDYEIKFIEESGLIIPMQTGIVPADGDEVILFNLRMPSEYIATAYAELEAAALKEIAERYTVDLNNYTVKSNPVAFNASDPQLKAGRSILFVNGDYSYTTRVIKVVRKMDYTCEQEITIGNDKIKGNTATLKEDVVNANSNINLLVELNQLTQNVTQAYQRTQQMILDNLNRAGNMWRFHPTIPDTIVTDYNVISAKEIINHGTGDLELGGSTLISVLAQLADVGIGSNLAAGHALVYNGERWVNQAIKSGLDETALAQYLSSHSYLTSGVLNGYLTKTVADTLYQPRGNYLTEHQSLDAYLTITAANAAYQPKGNYLTAHQSLANYYTKGDSDSRYQPKGNYLTQHQDVSNLLPKATFEEMFEKRLRPNGKWYIKAKADFVGVGEIVNHGTDDSDFADWGLGAIQLTNPKNGDGLVYLNGKWVNQAISQGLDESALASYLSNHNYVTSSALGGYLPLTGGMLSGNLSIVSGKSECGIRFGGSTASDDFVGRFGTYMSLYNHVGNAEIKLHDNKTVAVSGAVTVSAADFAVMHAYRSAPNFGAAVKFSNADGLLGHIGIAGSQGSYPHDAFFTNKDGVENRILHSGNYSGVLDNRYVTLNTSQEIAGQKIFTQEVRAVANGGIYSDPATGIACGFKTPNPIAAGSFIKSGGTSAQFLKADGSVDSNVYLTSHQALDYINVKDIRGTSPKPTDFAERKLTAWFNNTDKPGTNDWYSGLTVRGWYADYCVWQLSANSTNTITDSNLYFRIGRSDSWQSWQKVLTSAHTVVKSTVGTLGWVNNATNDAQIPTVSFLAYWNGAHSGTSSNLAYCNKGAFGDIVTQSLSGLDARYVNAAGDTMTGPLNFKNNTWNTVGDDVAIGDCNIAGCLGIKGLNGNPGLKFFDKDGNDKGTLTSNGSLLWNGNKIWHSGNDGAGSGLDADLLDGLHASSFLQRKDIRSDLNSIYDLRWNFGTTDEGDYHGTYASEYPCAYGPYLSLVYQGSNQGAIMWFNCSGNDLGRVYVNARQAGDSHTSFIGWKSLAFLTDNVASATKLQTARSLWGNSFNGENGCDGGLTFGLLTGANARNLLYQKMADNDIFRIRCGGTATNAGWVEFATADDGTEPIYVRQYTGEFATLARTLTLLDGSGNTIIPGKVGFGTDSPAYKVDINGDAIVRGWLRTAGATGWYSETFGGGWYMSDNTWLRTCNNKSIYSGSGEILSDNFFDRRGYIGASWNKGKGAYNVAITNNNSQTPLMVAYRDGQSPSVEGANRLFALELLNTGGTLAFGFGGAHKFTMDSNGNFEAALEIINHSDARLKSDIRRVVAGGRIRPVTYLMGGTRHVGLIAQEMQELCPDVVREGSDPLHLLRLNYSGALCYAFAGVYSEIDELKAENKRLKKRIEQLERRA